MYLFRKMAGSCFLNLGLVGGRVKNVKNFFFFFFNLVVLVLWESG